MKLSMKFGLVVLLLLGLTLGGGILLFLQNQRDILRLQEETRKQQEEAMENEARERASMVANFGEACRDYTQKVLSPAVKEYLGDKIVFEAQSRTFVARGTFEQFRKKKGDDYAFREASLNPLNRAKNLADADEAKLIANFDADRTLPEQSGFIFNEDGRELYFVARPILVEASCLGCHGRPELAPKEITKEYGTKSGFGWKEGEINSVLMVTVPAADLRAHTAMFHQQTQQQQQQQQAAVKSMLFIFVVMAGLLLVSLFSLFHFLVDRRIGQAAQVMRQVAANANSPERIQDRQGDEIGVMAQAFNHMADSLRESHQDLEHRVAERTNELVRTNQALEVEIDQRKRQEAELSKAKEAAEAANRAKSEFLANMSHEIRTPMNGVLCMTDLLLDTELTEQQREFLVTVKTSADSLLTVLKDILDFSKMEAGKLSLDPIDFRLRDNLAVTLNSLALRAHVKGLELACHVLPDVPDALVGDGDRLRQILINLVGNAIKFTEKGEVVVKVQAECQNDREVSLHLAIADTGIGIAASKQQVIFAPFVQADGSSTRRYGGTGLGLAISAHLVEMMGGRIWLESTEGKGSVFHFTVCLGVQPLADSQRLPSQPVNLRDLCVLVVDDNGTNRRILEAILSNWEMRPVCAADGAAALVELEKATMAGQPFTLILLDARMPDVDGLELARQIKHHPKWAGALILLLSSSDQAGSAERCRELGLAGYLTKPLSEADLLAAIQKGLGRVLVDAGGRKVVPTPGQADRKAEGDSLDSLKVLLAEDNPINQVVSVHLLEKFGCRVHMVATGLEAVAALEQQSFDLVLMDVQMPDLDGLEATAVIRRKEQGTGHRVPIIALTAHAMQGDLERCLAAGMDGYLAKPINSKQFREVLARFASIPQRQSSKG